jgi:hypothetical protein
MKRIDFTEILIKEWNRYKEKNKVTTNMESCVEAIMFCRTEILGGHEYKCECGSTHVEWNSCHNKMCPTCSNMYEERWLSEQHENIPDVRYGHIIFTLPHELNKYWLMNKEEVTRILFETVSEVLTEVYEYTYGLTPGIKVYFHSWNGEMNIHLHLHCVMTAGGLTKEGKWKDVSGNYIIPVEAVLKKYHGKLAYKLKGLRIKGMVPSGIESVEKIVKEKKLNVFLCDEYEGNAENILRYLAKRMRGGIFKDVKFYDIGGRKIKLEYKKGRQWKEKVLHVDELLRRFFYHIPLQGQKMVRNYGIFSSSKKKELQKVIEEKGILKIEIKELKKEIHCEKCNEVMVPHREIKSNKAEFIEAMMNSEIEVRGNKIRKLSMKHKICQMQLFEKAI